MPLFFFLKSGFHMGFFSVKGIFYLTPFDTLDGKVGGM